MTSFVKDYTPEQLQALRAKQELLPSNAVCDNKKEGLGDWAFSWDENEERHREADLDVIAHNGVTSSGRVRSADEPAPTPGGRKRSGTGTVTRQGTQRGQKTRQSHATMALIQSEQAGIRGEIQAVSNTLEKMLDRLKQNK